MAQRRLLVTIDWCWVGVSSAILSLFYLSFFMSRFIDTNEHMSFIPLGLGLVFSIFLLTVEQKGKKAGFLHHKLFLHRNFHLSIFTAFATGFVFVSFETYFGLETLQMYKSDPVFPRDYYMMAFASSILAGAIAAWYCSRYKAIRGVSSMGFAFCIPFYAAMASADQSTATYAFVFPIFIGIALGIVMVTLPTAAQLSIPSQLLSVGNGVFFFLFILGRFLGLVICKSRECKQFDVVDSDMITDDSLFFSTLDQGHQNIAGRLIFAGVPKESTATVIDYLISGSVGTVPDVPGLTDSVLEVGIVALKDCYLAAFKAVWTTACCFAGLSMIGERPTFFSIASPMRTNNWRS